MEIYLSLFLSLILTATSVLSFPLSLKPDPNIPAIQAAALKLPIESFADDLQLSQHSDRINGDTKYRIPSSDASTEGKLLFHRSGDDSGKEVIVLGCGEDFLRQTAQKRTYVVLRKCSKDPKIYRVSYAYVRAAVPEDAAEDCFTAQGTQRRIEWDAWDHRGQRKSQSHVFGWNTCTSAFVPCKDNLTEIEKKDTDMDEVDYTEDDESNPEVHSGKVWSTAIKATDGANGPSNYDLFVDLDSSPEDSTFIAAQTALYVYSLTTISHALTGRKMGVLTPHAQNDTKTAIMLLTLLNAKHGSGTKSTVVSSNALEGEEKSSAKRSADPQGAAVDNAALMKMMQQLGMNQAAQGQGGSFSITSSGTLGGAGGTLSSTGGGGGGGAVISTGGGGGAGGGGGGSVTGILGGGGGGLLGGLLGGGDGGGDLLGGVLGTFTGLLGGVMGGDGGGLLGGLLGGGDGGGLLGGLLGGGDGGGLLGGLLGGGDGGGLLGGMLGGGDGGGLLGGMLGGGDGGGLLGGMLGGGDGGGLLGGLLGGGDGGGGLLGGLLGGGLLGGFLGGGGKKGGGGGLLGGIMGRTMGGDASKGQDANTDLFLKVGWRTQDLCAGDIAKINDLDEGAFIGFGSCPLRQGTTENLAAINGTEELVEFYTGVLRTNCHADQKNDIVNLFSTGYLRINDDKTASVPDTLKVLKDRKLLKSELKDLEGAMEFATFTQVYSKRLNDPATMVKFTPCGKPISKSVSVTVCVTLETINKAKKKSPEHLIKIARSSVKTLQSAFAKLLQDADRYKICSGCNADVKQIVQNDMMYLKGAQQFVIVGLEAIKNKDIITAFNDFYNLNHVELKNKLTQYFKF